MPVVIKVPEGGTITFVARRWDVHVVVADSDENIISSQVASADGGLTEHSGIWWGTREDYVAACSAGLRP